MKGKLQFPVSLCWFLPVLVFMLVSCGDDDDYHYPSVKLDFLTAQAGADGSLQSVLTDEGETLAIVEDASKTRIDANASARIVSNFPCDRLFVQCTKNNTSFSFQQIVTHTFFFISNNHLK